VYQHSQALTLYCIFNYL